MTFEEIFAVDTFNMYRLIKEFPAQASEAVMIGNSMSLKVATRGIEHVVVSGLGGSAIGGDLLRSYVAGELKVPFLVNRNYTLPAFIGPRSLVFISSYSGSTEETIAAYREAVRKRARVICVSSNGTLEKLAKRGKKPLVKIPGGLPPRAALGYGFFPILIALSRLGLVTNKTRQINETIELLQEKSDEYGNPDPDSNRALRLAQQLKGRIGIVYSSTDRFDAVNTRWRSQIAENAKSLAFGHLLPEMNHNELVGWKVLTGQMREIQVFVLRDEEDHERIQLRMDFTKEVLAGYTTRVTEVRSEGSSPLARMFSLLYLGDWMSYYLAILNREDPTPVRVIDDLKELLSKT